MLPLLDGEHREDAVRFRISGDVPLGMTAGRATGTRVELRGTAAEAVAIRAEASNSLSVDRRGVPTPIGAASS